MNRLTFAAVCFAAGTLLWPPDGYRPVEEIQPNDFVFSRDEHDAFGPIKAMLVEEKFERTGRILHLHLADGKLIRTTPEHPFFVEDKGWTAAGALEPDDRVRTDTGWMTVEEVFDTGEYEKVYNLRVAEWHTYFVGEEGQGEAVWAHNTCEPVFIRTGNDAAAAMAATPGLALGLQKAQEIRNANHDFQRNLAVAVGIKNGQIVYATALSSGRNNHSEKSIYEQIQSWDKITVYFSERVPCDRCRSPIGNQGWFYQTMLWARTHGGAFPLFSITNAVSDFDPNAAVNVSNFYSSLPPL